MTSQAHLARAQELMAIVDERIDDSNPGEPSQWVAVMIAAAQVHTAIAAIPATRKVSTR